MCVCVCACVHYVHVCVGKTKRTCPYHAHARVHLRVHVYLHLSLCLRLPLPPPRALSFPCPRTPLPSQADLAPGASLSSRCLSCALSLPSPRFFAPCPQHLQPGLPSHRLTNPFRPWPRLAFAAPLSMSLSLSLSLFQRFVRFVRLSTCPGPWFQGRPPAHQLRPIAEGRRLLPPRPCAPAPSTPRTSDRGLAPASQLGARPPRGRSMRPPPRRPPGRRR